MDADATLTLDGFSLPFSSFASTEARAEAVERVNALARSGSRGPMGPGELEQARKFADLRVTPYLTAAKALFPTTSERSTIAGVPIETFVPAGGIAPRNNERVLINLHGGGFVAGGGGPMGAVESIPIAGEMGIRVVAVDYRLSPEHRFPAASEDLELVYRELLKTFEPERIGIFGCSAGGILSVQSVPWFLDKKLPLPGALAIISASAHTFDEGDSAHIWTRLGSAVRVVPPATPPQIFGPTLPYLTGVSTRDPMAVPGVSSEVMSQFPPTLFLTGTRAPEMSGAAQSHLQLLELGRVSQLVLYDGMDHSFLKDPRIPESRSAFRQIARFMDKHLR